MCEKYGEKLMNERGSKLKKYFGSKLTDERRSKLTGEIFRVTEGCIYQTIIQSFKKRTKNMITIYLHLKS